MFILHIYHHIYLVHLFIKPSHLFILNLDNTNNLKFELYVVHAEVDGMGFPLAYLFLENNGNCGNGKRTGVIIDFFLLYFILFELFPGILFEDY